LDFLSVGGQSYSNLTIITKGSTHVSFKHSKGFASVKVKDLSQDIQVQLGYTPPPPPKKPLDFANDLTKDLKGFQIDPKFKEMQQQIRKDVERMIEERNPVFIYGVTGGLAVAYLFFCYTAMLICQKTGNQPGLLVWIPVFQFIPLLKAAGMSGWWFIICILFPPITVLVQIVWCFKICITRGKSPALGVLLLLPVLGFFTWLYLAFADGKKEETTKPKSNKNSGKLRLSYQNQNS